MCVIAAKPAGVDMPSDQYISNMWTRNSDGAGIMYTVGGRVHIEKGFMKFDQLHERLDQLHDLYDLKELPVVMHFRITTHGGTKAENCHPFPISESVGVLSKLNQTTNIGVAHNGIIDITPRKGISDTMEYIISQLAPLSKAVPNFYENKYLMKMISNAIDSKMAFLTDRGDIYTIGTFTEDNGIKYSNTSYKCPTYSLANYVYSHAGIYYPDGWEVVDSTETSHYRSVMWLDDGEYVRNPRGDMLDGDYAIDCMSNVFCYSYDFGCLIRCSGYRAYTENGAPLKYDADSQLITYEEVIF
jgi:predicted glutamine amidotransferase